MILSLSQTLFSCFPRSHTQSMEFQKQEITSMTPACNRMMMKNKVSTPKNSSTSFEEDDHHHHHQGPVIEDEAMKIPDTEEMKKQKRFTNNTGIMRLSSAGLGGSGGDKRGMISCQAEKCTADLRVAKRYHRRHKVCEFHAKAPSVLVSALRQRFCQQCSRFHELSEFDETKRSCRRRLAGHNERRRKSSSEPQGESGSSSHTKGSNLQFKADDHERTPYKHFQIR